MLKLSPILLLIATDMTSSPTPAIYGIPIILFEANQAHMPKEN